MLSSIYKKIEVVFYLQKKVRPSSILSLPNVVPTKYSYFDTPTDGRPAYSDIKANSA